MFEKVKEVLMEAINVDEDMIKMEANLKDDLGIDSLAAVELSLELEVDEMKIKMEKGAAADSRAVHMEPVITEPLPPVTAALQTAPLPAVEVKKAAGTWVKAPLVGTYYNARSQGGTPFVEIGQQVKKGDVLCIIEAMKVMNEIPSPVDGIVQEILITNEAMVEFDQELIRIGEAA